MSVRSDYLALFLAVALSSGGCLKPSGELCERRQGIAEGLEIIKAYYSFCLERAQAGTLDGETIIRAKTAMLNELRSHPEVSSYILLRKRP